MSILALNESAQEKLENIDIEFLFNNFIQRKLDFQFVIIISGMIL